MINTYSKQLNFHSRVKSGNFEHQVNSDTHLQTVEIQMRRLPSHQDFHCLLFVIQIIKI